MTTEARKRANKKWDAANMQNLSIKVRRSYADQIREKTARAGTTPAAIMRKAIDDFMQTDIQEKEENQS